MTTSDRIAAAIKPILDEDRREDRERIAELERDLVFSRSSNDDLRDKIVELREIDNAQTEAIDRLNKQLDELTEKCAALVMERDQLRWKMVTGERDNSTLRIDPDMSDPQPGKLLVVRLEPRNVDEMKRGWTPAAIGRLQLVGFLVETPAVEVKRAVKAGDKVRVRGENGEVVHVGFMTAEVRLHHTGKIGAYLIAEIEVIE